MQDATSAAPDQRAGRREWTGLAVLALPTLLVALDIGALFLALPHLSTDLGASSAQQLWVTDIYLFMLAGFLITMGSLGDRIGRRRLLLFGAGAFTLASVLAAYSTSPEMLIASRALLGIAGATMSPSTLALISNMFRNERERGVALSIWATCMFGGGALGPVIGGVLLNEWWWGSVFLLGVPVMGILLVAGPMLLPEYRNPDAAGRLDITSVVLSLAAILPIIYGIKNFAASDANPPLAVGAIAVGLALGAWFIRRQLRLPDPLLDLRLVGQRAIRVALPTMLIGSAALAGTSLMTTQYIQSVEGRSPAESGLWMSFTGIGIAAGTMLAPMLVRKVRPATVMVAGLAASAAALLVLTQAEDSGWLVGVVACIAVVAFGMGPLFVLGTGMVVGSAPPERAGSAASISETSNVFGSSLGLALLGSAGAAAYRGRMADVDLTAFPAEVGELARETVAAATAAGDPLLLEIAGRAFTDALNVVAGIGAVIFVAVALLIMATLRRDATGPAPEPADAGSEPAAAATAGPDPAATAGPDTATAAEATDRAQT